MAHPHTTPNMSMNYKPGQIANYMLQMTMSEGRPLSLLKLLKLVYIGYGWSLAVIDKKLFEEPVQAWAHGPVIPSIYHEFKHYGASPITELAREFDLDNKNPCGKGTTLCEPLTLDNDVQKLLGIVWNVYKEFNAWDLRDKTHEDGTPWKQVYEEGKNREIPCSSIKEYFGGNIDKYIARLGN